MEYLALGIAVFLGGVVCGFAGFAFSAVAGAILCHFFEPMVAVPLMMFCSIASQMASLTMLRLICWQEIAPLLIGGTAGVPIALYILTRVDAGTFRTGFGVFLASYSGYMLLQRPGTLVLRAAGVGMRSAVGFAGGFLGGLTAMPGALPMVWCDLRGISKEHQRGLVQPFIVGMQLLAVLLLLLTPGALHRDLLMMLALAVPILVVGSYIGAALFEKINDRQFRYAVLVLLLISGCLMIPWRDFSLLSRLIG